LQEQQAKHLQAYRSLEESYNQKLQRAEEKKLQLSQYNKYESETYKELKEEKCSSAEILIKHLETEKSELLMAKRDAEQKTTVLKDSLGKLRDEYEFQLNEKEEIIITLKA
jgi:hypothetical protein